MTNPLLASERLKPLALTLVACIAFVGCGGGGVYDLLETYYGTPFYYAGTASSSSGIGSSGVSSGGSLTGGSSGTTDPCDETEARKFIRISMRNESDDYVHYFLILVAFVNSDTYPNGAVCADDVQLYMSNGYISVAEGRYVELGGLCIPGPALYYFHRNGQFQQVSGNTISLASAIAPGSASSPSYDATFTSAGKQIPVPDIIMFHNPGIGQGSSLLIADLPSDPCGNSGVLETVDPSCEWDSFYYVDENDRIVGSDAIGYGSGRRVPNEVQGTGCQCGISNDPYSILAPPTVSASTVADSSGYCDAFMRGGRIDYVFLREDTDPAFPQLVWRVRDASGTRVHDFDSRSGVN